MATQTERGKAFEYACLSAIYHALARGQSVEMIENSSISAARRFYNALDYQIRGKMDSAALAAIRTIVRLEPQLHNPLDNVPLFLTIQEDARGIVGDVRDILCIRRQNQWEIGLSCKHNHFAVKHSRLSNTIDFGLQWFNRPCSQEYFNEIDPLFCELRQLKRGQVLWRDIPNKDIRFYVPLLTAFRSELRRLNTAYPGEIPGALITYLLGRNDFYKVISNESNCTTIVQAYNISGTLNRTVANIPFRSHVPRIRVPNHIFDIRFEINSTNTLMITCDNGWAVSMRIHNASSIVEPSLKFDVNLVGIPPAIGTIVEPWNNR